jgi:hypothetical protein
LLVVAAGVAARIGLDLYRQSLLLTGLSDNPAPVALTVAAERLKVPGNMLRQGRAPADPARPQIDIVLRWPSLTGFTRASAGDFTSATGEARLIYGTVSQRTTALDAGQRLTGIYAQFFVGDPVPAPGGLTARRLSPDSGYDGETVYYGPDGPNRFVARCALATAETPATCLRDIDFGVNLTLSYRFDVSLMGDWQALDAGLQALAGRMTAGG